MKKILALLLCLMLTQAHAAGWLPLVKIGGGGGATLAIDGTGVINNGSATPLVMPELTTTLSNDIVVVDVQVNFNSVLSITSTSGLTFTFHAGIGNGGLDIERWIAKATSPLTGEVITINLGSATSVAAIAYAVSGANVSSYPTSSFDSGGPQTGTVDPLSITTVTAPTFVLCTFREGSAGSPTPGSGFTGITGNFMLSQWKSQATTATVSCTQTTGAGTANGVIADALH